VNPTILNGRSTSQTKGKRMSMMRARGQHNTKRRHQRTMERNILMGLGDMGYWVLGIGVLL
jgi:hypothetical protein